MRKEGAVDACNVQWDAAMADSTAAVNGKRAITMEAARLYVRSKLNDPRELKCVIIGTSWRLYGKLNAEVTFRSDFERRWLYNLRPLLAGRVLLTGGVDFVAEGA